MSDRLTIELGDVIAGKYRVDRVIGQGGMGMVVAAHHLELDDAFAIKFLLPEALGSPSMIERFMREARASAKLRSDHVVKVSDVGRLPDGAPYLVMELLEGQDLAALLDQRGPLPPKDYILYLVQAAEAIGEAHAAGIVHRDLKPANLFLSHKLNGTPCVKVLDFGISKQMEKLGPAVTKTNAVMGTPLYMSPEQMRSSKLVDSRSDIWSLGVILYELSTGSDPYDAETATELIAKVLAEPPIAPHERKPDLPPPIERVILTCLERDPAARYASAGQFAEALLEAGRELGIDLSLAESTASFAPAAATARPQSPTTGSRDPTVTMHAPPSITLGAVSDARPPGKRSRAGIAAAVGLLVALAGGGFLWRRASKSHERADVHPPPPVIASVAPPTATTSTPEPPPADRSPLPTIEEWNAVTREVAVRGSSKLGCETKMVREWLRVSCRGKNAERGEPLAVELVRGVQGSEHTFKGEGVTSLLVRFVEGVDLDARFTFTSGSSVLRVVWPRGVAEPPSKGQFQALAPPKPTTSASPN